MNLYAIVPSYAPNNEVTIVLADSTEDAMKHAVFVAAYDLVNDLYCSPTANVYLIGSAVWVGEARAEDAPASWKWAKDVPRKLASADEDIPPWQ